MAVQARVREGERLVVAAGERGATVRLLGGAAVALRCASAGGEDAPLARSYGDLDLVTDRRSAAAVAELLEHEGYVPHRSFNATHGRSRMLFDEPDGEGGHVDVFVGAFAMCHTLELQERLALDARTLPLADLLLTKLQIAQLNRKDVVDTAALLLDHEVTTDDDGINVDYLARLLCADWGWWRTVTENVGMLLEHLPSLELDATAAGAVERRAGRILDEVAERPKSLRWRARARVGERVPWRDEPEEIGA